MKLIFAIIQTDDTDNVVAILNQQGYMVTKLNSTGGFLRKGNSTLMIGIPEEKVNDVIRIFKEECGRRQQMMDPVPYMDNQFSWWTSSVSRKCNDTEGKVVGECGTR